MTPEQLIAAGFTQGLHERLPVGFPHVCTVIRSEAAPESLQKLKAKGFSNFEADRIGTMEVYKFTRIPDLETRLREHVDAFFPKS